MSAHDDDRREERELEQLKLLERIAEALEALLVALKEKTP